MVPVVAAVNGICQAGALLITMLCDVAVASDRATFRAPELLRGFAEMWYAAVLPAQVGVARARELMMTARRIDAQEALAIGLIGRVVPHESLEEEAEQTLLEILETAPGARTQFKRAVNARYGVPDEITFRYAQTSPETIEGFASFMEKRRPAWTEGLPEPRRRHGR
jgi:enoyl-CoA hydratase/carnithine racemase